MKKIISLLLTLCMLLGMTAAMADETWFCPNCGTENTSNFCGECGTKKTTEWTCPTCGTLNESKFCGECGTARTAAQVQSAAEPTPVPQTAGLTATARVEFYHLENRAKVYLSTADEFYADDYAEDTNYFLAINITNNTEEDKSFTLTAKVNGEGFSFAPYTLAAGDDHGFYISSVNLVPGVYKIEWLVDGATIAEKTVTIKSGHSDFYSWMTQNVKTSVGMCVWDKESSMRVRNGVDVGYTSQLQDGQIYCPHLILENNDSKSTPSMYVSFFMDGSSWWWADEVINANHTMNYVHSHYEHKEGTTEVVMFINGIEVSRGMLNIVMDK